MVASDRSRLTLRLSVPYATRWGQMVRVVGAGAALGDGNAETAPELACRHVGDRLLWVGEVTVPRAASYTYKYVVVGEGGNVEDEELSTRELQVPAGIAAGALMDVRDEWQSMASPNFALSRSAFSEVILANRAAAPAPERPQHVAAAEGEVVLRLRVWDYGLAEGQDVCVLGTLPALGNWQPEQALRLTRLESPHWQAEVRAPLGAFPVSYKYALRDSDGVLTMEHGENRTASLPEAGEAEAALVPPAAVVQCDGPFRHEHRWRGAGLAVPVFALRTRRSVGVGEFADIKQLADFGHAAGMRLIQLLPVNDTSVHRMWWDSYPYSSISVFALHPLYLSLDALSDDAPPEVQQEIQTARQELDLPDVDYDGTMAAKLRIARQLFEIEGDALLQSRPFQQWFEDNREWVQPYAAFCFLRDLFGNAEHWHWGSLSKPTQQDIERLTSPERDYHASIRFTYYLQYHLHAQLLDASQHAARLRIALKGDLPIGVDKRSVDTWMEPSLFRMEVSTGAPPDYFAPEGQNWGFPTYCWEEMAKDGYRWWRRRLRQLSLYFHAYRIDHVLGFFRIWEIPAGCTTGLLGHFRPSIPISRSELESSGIWDMDRLTQPFVTWSLLVAEFSELAAEVASKYFTELPTGRYDFRPAYDSEAAIKAIAPRPESPQWLVEEISRTRAGLLRLRQNVVLLPNTDDSESFYPRIRLMDTSSWRELDAGWRDRLAWLHDDYFFRRQDALWKANALRTLPALMRATDMLVCGEDLGMIPACVPPVMDQLGLVGLRIQRMPSELGQEFNDVPRYPYMAVASPSCHDTTTTRSWWEEDAGRRERFFGEELHMQGEAPERCTPEVMRAVFRQHLESPTMWTIFPIQDVMALSAEYIQRPAAEETINDPTNPKHYWRYRMHVTVEDLCADRQLLGDLQDLLVGSGRVSLTQLPEVLGDQPVHANGPVPDGLE